MPPVTPPVTAPPGRYGDLNITDGHVTVAPDITRIGLAALQQSNVYTIAGDRIIVCGEVWYRPFDIDPNTMTLLCVKTVDGRPLLAQARTRC